LKIFCGRLASPPAAVGSQVLQTWDNHADSRRIVQFQNLEFIRIVIRLNNYPANDSIGSCKECAIDENCSNCDEFELSFVIGT
jgi:hypothetical protein